MNFILYTFLAVVLVLFVISMTQVGKSVVAKAVVSIISTGLLLFCAFGFLASGEYSGAEELKWKLLYSGIGICCLALATLPWLVRRKPSSSRE